MIAIINNKRYNTETATHIYGWSNGHYTNDFARRSKDLYRTKKGTWFIHHTGGPMTDMASSHGSNLGWGEKIEPVSDTDAFRFLQTHGGEEAADKYFGDQIEEA